MAGPLRSNRPHEASTRASCPACTTGANSRGLIPRGEQFNPCHLVKGREFSQVTGYETLALEIEDTLKVLSELKQPEYELALLVATCGLLHQRGSRSEMPSISVGRGEVPPVLDREIRKFGDRRKRSQSLV